MRSIFYAFGSAKSLSKSSYPFGERIVSREFFTQMQLKMFPKLKRLHAFFFHEKKNVTAPVLVIGYKKLLKFRNLFFRNNQHARYAGRIAPWAYADQHSFSWYSCLAYKINAGGRENRPSFACRLKCTYISAFLQAGKTAFYISNWIGRADTFRIRVAGQWVRRDCRENGRANNTIIASSLWQGCRPWSLCGDYDTCAGYTSQSRAPRHKHGGRHVNPMERFSPPPSVSAFEKHFVI